jgi:hypothetical protein
MSWIRTTGTGKYVRLYLDRQTSKCEITIAGPPRCLKDGIARHNPGSLAQLCGAGRKGDINGAGVAAGDANLDGAAPGVDLLVNSHLKQLVVLQRAGGQHQAVVEFLNKERKYTSVADL